MLGDTVSVLLFSVAVSMVDFAGLARVLTPETKMKDEGFFVIGMFIVWIAAALCDILLTWWWATLQMEAVNAGANLPANVGIWMLEVFPWAIAIMEFAIRMPLILMIGHYGEQLFDVKITLPRRNTRMSTPGFKPQSKPSTSATPINIFGGKGNVDPFKKP